MEQRVRQLELTVNKLIELVQDMDARLRVLYLAAAQGGGSTKPKPSDAEVIALMEELGKDWAYCMNQLMEEDHGETE